jgi:hypothetical protein
VYEKRSWSIFHSVTEVTVEERLGCHKLYSVIRFSVVALNGCPVFTFLSTKDVVFYTVLHAVLHIQSRLRPIEGSYLLFTGSFYPTRIVKNV